MKKMLESTDDDKDKYKVTVELQDERYFEGERVSQIINSNVN